MALVKHLEEIKKEKCSVHEEVECTFTIFGDKAGNKYLQLDTYGSPTREIPGKVSQSLQFDQTSIGRLKQIIEKEF